LLHTLWRDPSECLSVCLCVRNWDESCKNGWTGGDVFWYVGLQVDPHNHVLDGGMDPPRGMGNFGGEQTRACPRSVQKGAWIFPQKWALLRRWVAHGNQQDKDYSPISWRLLPIWLWGDDAAFCQISLTSFFFSYLNVVLLIVCY